VLCLLAVILTYWQHRAHGGGQQSLPEQVAQRLMQPLQSTVASVFNWSYGLFVSLTHARELTEENRRLRDENARLEAEKLDLHQYFLENKELRDKLGFVIAGEVKGVPARVIGRSSTAGGPKITIESVGSRELEVGNMVRTQQGLVGRVISAQKSRGDVLLLSHSDHAVAATVYPSGDQGMVYAMAPGPAGEMLLQMEKLRGEANIRVGDVVVTSNLSGIYPPGIRIGTVTRVQTAPASSRAFRAIIKPAADLKNITYVLVVRSAK